MWRSNELERVTQRIASGLLGDHRKKDLLTLIAERKWGEVIKLYETDPESLKVTIDTGDTAIHLAISDHQHSGVKEMVKEMVKDVESDVLATENNQGNTPLHLAASLGSTDICKCIVEKDPNLTSLKNRNGENPLFLAVANGNMDAFVCLQYYWKDEEDKYKYFRRANEDTILHAAISGQHFDIAYYIIHWYGILVHKVNNQGESPINLLAAMPHAFESGNPLIGLSRLIYHSITVGKLKQILSDIVKDHNQNPQNPGDVSPAGHSEYGQQDEAAPMNDQPANSSESHQQDAAPAGEEGVGDRRAMAIGCLLLPIWLPFLIVYWVIKYMPSFLMALFKLVMFISGYEHYTSLKHLKKRCTLSVEVMKELIRRSADEASTPQEPTTKMETTLFIAAKHGVVEIAKRILDDHPGAIYHKNTEGKNIFMLTAENRRPRLYEYLLQKPRTIAQSTDNQGNNVLHFAAKLGNQRPWPIRGAALQMHMEVKWFNYVKDSMATYTFDSQNNKKPETPEKIFEDSHKELKEEARQWLIDNSQSCSVVAALIATVAFATYATFPGGFKQDSGIPALENDPVFIISAVASLTALCSSMISVVMFLGILTSDFQQADFLNDLPFKYLVAMVSLLVSILSMLVCFLAGHLFVLKQKLKIASLPAYVALCLPLLYFIIKNFPLDYPTIRTTLKKKPQ